MSFLSRRSSPGITRSSWRRQKFLGTFFVALAVIAPSSLGKEIIARSVDSDSCTLVVFQAVGFGSSLYSVPEDGHCTVRRTFCALGSRAYVPEYPVSTSRAWPRRDNNETAFKTAVSKSLSRLASKSKDACRNLRRRLKTLTCSPDSPGRSTVV
jgi:hypothetical protein